MRRNTGCDDFTAGVEKGSTDLMGSAGSVGSAGFTCLLLIGLLFCFLCNRSSTLFLSSGHLLKYFVCSENSSSFFFPLYLFTCCLVLILTFTGGEAVFMWADLKCHLVLINQVAREANLVLFSAWHLIPGVLNCVFHSVAKQQIFSCFSLSRRRGYHTLVRTEWK